MDESHGGGLTYRPFTPGKTWFRNKDRDQLSKHSLAVLGQLILMKTWITRRMMYTGQLICELGTNS